MQQKSFFLAQLFFLDSLTTRIQLAFARWPLASPSSISLQPYSSKKYYTSTVFIKEVLHYHRSITLRLIIKEVLLFNRIHHRSIKLPLIIEEVLHFNRTHHRSIKLRLIIKEVLHFNPHNQRSITLQSSKWKKCYTSTLIIKEVLRSNPQSKRSITLQSAVICSL